MEKTLQEQLQKWHEGDEYDKIVEAIQAVPQENWDYELICQLARALNNLDKMEEALAWLLTVAEQGANDPLWYYRLGYAYYYLDQEDKALEAFVRACALDPEDEDAWMFMSWCCDILKIEPPLEVPENKRHYFQKESQSIDWHPEYYTEEEMQAVEAHIAKYFGQAPSVFHELMSPDIHVDVYMIPPTVERNYYTLVTCGMGAHRMAVPEDMKDSKIERAELLICLPPDWDLQSQEEAWYWPMRWLKQLARLPGENDTWLAWGHTVSNGEPFAENTMLSGAILLTPGAFGNEAAICKLEDGDEINFYQVVPLYIEEMDYKISHDTDKLLELMGDDLLRMVDINRKNVCEDMEQQEFHLSNQEIMPILKNWEGPDGCFASNRILQDGCKVGYMYRQVPDGQFPDSGWRFAAGDEDSDYMADPNNAGVYKLNTICNYDPDIMPFLNAPFGTAFLRDENGDFQKDTMEANDGYHGTKQ